MKLQILSGALGLVLLLSLVPLPPAEAKIFIIDDFENDTALQQCDIIQTTAGSSGIKSQTPVVGVISLLRECLLFLDVANAPSNGATLIAGLPQDVGAGMFRMMAGTGVETTVTLFYDGVVGLATGRALALNLLDSDNLRITYSKSDFQVDGTATMWDSGGDAASLPFTLLAGTVSSTEINLVLTDFVVVNPLLNLNDIDEIRLVLDTVTDATDYDLDLIDITMQMVGGEMFPVDTTALLLAGAELNAIWILPAIAAIGIGAFIVSRKRN